MKKFNSFPDRIDGLFLNLTSNLKMGELVIIVSYRLDFWWLVCNISAIVIITLNAFTPPIYTSSQTGNRISTRQVKIRNRENYFHDINSKGKNANSGGEKNTFLYTPILIVCVLSIFLQKNKGHNPSETDVKVLFLALTYYSLEKATEVVFF